jgi:AcrR family transcriptional regulator
VSRPARQSRRVPRQERALSTVDAILQAAARVMVEQGYERTTTTRIAEVAGVSIGSLYQYFPSKAALVVELSRRLSARVLEAMSAAAHAPEHETLEQVSRALVTALTRAYSVNPPLNKLLLEEQPRVRALRGANEVEIQVEAILRARLARHADELRMRDLDLAAFMLCRSVRAVVWSAVMERPDTLQTPQLLDELTAMAVGFLRG